MNETSLVGSSFFSASLVASLPKPSLDSALLAWFVTSVALPAYCGSTSASLIRQMAVPTSSTATMAYEAMSANNVASQLGQPCRRAHPRRGSTAMVSTSASMMGATMPAAALIPMPTTTTPTPPSSTTTERGRVDDSTPLEPAPSPARSGRGVDMGSPYLSAAAGGPIRAG